MTTIARRLSALEAASPPENDERAWPWLTLLWRYGEPKPEVPPQHNAFLVRLVSPRDPPEWRARGDEGRS